MAKHIQTNIKVHSADNSLQKKFGGAGALQKIFTPERIAKGQNKIEEFKESYFDEELPVIEEAAKGQVDNLSVLRESAKSLKGQTEALGFGFIMKVTDSLYKYLLDKEELSKNDVIVVQKHAEAILAGIEKRERGWGGMIESELLSTIEMLVKKFSKKN
jgi:hypothetical protein